MFAFLLNRRGSAAILIGLTLIPITLAAGAAIDYGQTYFAARSLQGVVDAAALAGVAAYTEPSAAKRTAAINAATAFFNKGVSGMSGVTVGTPTITANADSVCSNSSAAATVTVSAPVTTATTIMGMAVDSITTTMTATARNPLVPFSLDLGSFMPGRDDGHKLALHWYKVPVGGGVPAPTDLHFISDNINYSSAQVFSACVFAEDQIALALEVWPYAIWNYSSSDEYGSHIGQHYFFYSGIYPPNSAATPLNAHGRDRNCSLQIDEIVNGVAVPSLIKHKCFSTSESKPFAAIAANGSVSCAGLNGRTVRFQWNDMGPDSHAGPNGAYYDNVPDGTPSYYDDLDYDDLALTYTCAVPKQNKADLVH